jgi:hypothetical protein
MKTMKNLALMSAIALTGAVGFTACSSSDDLGDNSPNINPDNATVKTAITMNIGRGGQTRMASAVTQTSNQPFRGMFNVYIYPASVYNETTWAPIIGSSTINDPVVVNNTIDAITASASNKTYSNVQVPIATNNFLFYGRAGSTAPASVEDKLAKGFTVPSFPTSSPTIGGISFAAQEIFANPATNADWTGPAGVLVNYLNSIKTAIGTNPLSNAQFEALRLDFLKPSTPRAGSAEAVRATVQHMYTTISAYTGLNEADQAKATAVINAIKAAPASESGDVISWATGEVTPKLTETTFPANLGLPLGAAQYQYNTTNSAFEYVTDATPTVANTPVADFIYPSELFYFTNTPLKETSGNVDWPNTPATWTSASYSAWGDAVQASSKNIALVNNVQYGTALLATQVKCTPDASNKLYDNSKEKDPTVNENKAITYQDNMFPLTGVLVGTQPSSVGWNFLPTGTYSKCIYDKNVTYYNTTNSSEETIYANATGDNYSGLNYTLVYDNNGYLNTDNNGSVNICLEFTNNSNDDFYGKDGLIKKGQRFYLIGKLDLTSKTKPTQFPTAVGNNNAVYYPSVDLRVFIQDYTTTARCNITAGSATEKGSLANALSCIPDMKAVTQEIGLSVDLVWTPGLTFDVSLGQ